MCQAKRSPNLRIILICASVGECVLVRNKIATPDILDLRNCFVVTPVLCQRYFVQNQLVSAADLQVMRLFPKRYSSVVLHI